MVDAFRMRMILIVTINNKFVGFESLKDIYKDDDDFKVVWEYIDTKVTFVYWSVFLLQTHEGLKDNLGHDKAIVVEEMYFCDKLMRDVGSFF